MPRNPEIKDLMVGAASFWMLRVAVGLVVLALYLMASALAVVLAGGYRLEVLIFCAGILPLPIFIAMHVILSRISWRRFNHGLHYRNHPLFLLIPLACLSVVALNTVMTKEGHLDWYFNWQARRTYIGRLPGFVDCVHMVVGKSTNGQTNLFQLKGEPEKAIEHLRGRLVGHGFNETDEAPYTDTNELPDWWRSQRRNERAMLLRFEHPDNRVIGVWQFPDSDSLYIEVSRRY